ncbi:MAG: SGNH/GDSL hydrolase family protein, partial [Armatimonadota bacterium]
MIQLFAELDAKLFVLDCLGNMMSRNTHPEAEVKRRIAAAVHYLQSKRPTVPIVLAEFAAFHENRLDGNRGDAIAAQNTLLKDAFAALQKSGVKNIYLLTAKEMNMGMDDTTDYGHPN